MSASPSSIPPSKQQIEIAAPYHFEGGNLWIVRLGESFVYGDIVGSEYGSDLILYEDGVPLREAHAAHDDIRQTGHGLYSHWADCLFFSTSDNSDPNTNGRQYTVGFVPYESKIRVIGVGSCHVSIPLNIIASRQSVRIVAPFYHTHYTQEVLQLIALYRGELTESPALLRRMVFEQGQAQAGTYDIRNAEAVLVEICNPYPIAYDGRWLSRTALSVFLTECAERSDEEGHLAREWFFNGISKQDEAVRSEAARQLSAVWTDDSEQGRVDLDIIQRAHGLRQTKEDLRQGILDVCGAFGVPTGVLSHTLRYMPDGRPLSWPTDFYRTVNEICSEERIPIYNPQTLVAELGAEASLTADLQHHPKTFYEVMADRLQPMIERLSGRSLPSIGGREERKT